jgi:hypothetical protein
MEKQEKLILEFRTWNKKILLFDQYQKLLKDYPVNEKFNLLEGQGWPMDQKIQLTADDIKSVPLWPVNIDKEKRGIDLLTSSIGVGPELHVENLFIINDGYLYFDEDKLQGVMPVYLSRVLLEWLPFKSNVSGQIEEAFRIDDVLGIESVYSLAGKKLGNSRVYAIKLRKYLLEKAENLGNLR